MIYSLCKPIAPARRSRLIGGSCRWGLLVCVPPKRSGNEQWRCGTVGLRTAPEWAKDKPLQKHVKKNSQLEFDEKSIKSQHYCVQMLGLELFLILKRTCNNALKCLKSTDLLLLTTFRTRPHGITVRMAFWIALLETILCILSSYIWTGVYCVETSTS